MICKCGNILVRGQTLCDVCGEPVGEQGTAYIARPRNGIKPPKPPIMPAQQSQAQYAPRVELQLEEPPVEQPKELSKGKRSLVLSVIFASAALVISGGTIAFLKIFGFI